MSRKRAGLSEAVVGAQIRAERERLGLSVAEAARRLNLHRQGYQRLERGKNFPGLKTLMALKGLGMNLRAVVPELYWEDER